MKKIFLIQGIILQEGIVFGLANKPGVGTAVKIENAMTFAMFHAVVGRGILGQMHDRWGDSTITELVITGTRLQFKKEYEKRPPIFYEYVKRDDIWVGTWKGKDCGTGTTRCVVVPVDDSFLEF